METRRILISNTDEKREFLKSVSTAVLVGLVSRRPYETDDESRACRIALNLWNELESHANKTDQNR